MTSADIVKGRHRKGTSTARVDIFSAEYHSLFKRVNWSENDDV